MSFITKIISAKKYNNGSTYIWVCLDIDQEIINIQKYFKILSHLPLLQHFLITDKLGKVENYIMLSI